MSAYSEVTECYLMTGESDYMIRVDVPDIPALERFIIDELSKIPGVANIRSSFALKQVKYQTALPLPQQRPVVRAGTRGRGPSKQRNRP